MKSKEIKETKKIIEHKFFVLDTAVRNKNHRFYGDEVVSKWPSDKRLKNEGIDIEFALEENAETENEYLIDHLSCGIVKVLELEGTKLYATVKFKLNDLTKDIYEEKLKLDDIAIVPKGKGSVKNQRVQDDYELFGFNLVKKNESTFIFDEKEAETETAKSA